MGEFRGTELSDVVIDSERLRLRPWRVEDVAEVTAALGDPAMGAFLALPQPYTEADALEFVSRTATTERAEGTGLDCAVVERHSGAVVGSASLRLPFRMRPSDIGYWTAPRAQGNGYAAEATRALAGWAFDHGVHRLELHLDVRNIASARVALQAGFGFEHISREALPEPDWHADLAVFVRTADDPGRAIEPRFPPLPAGGLTDGVVVLRSPVPADLDGFAEQEDDPVTKQVGFSGRTPPRAAMRRMLNRARLDHLVGPGTYFSIVDAARDEYAGTIRLRDSGPPNVGGIGYAVHPRFRGRGFTTRALRLLSTWAFEHAGYARLELGAKVANVASQRAALAAGFEADGVKRSRLRNADGSFSDEARFALINPKVAQSDSPSRISP